MQKLSVLFYGLNMTQYQEIDVRRQLIYNESPDDVKTLIKHLSCMSQSGHPSKGEGCDFILENQNKRVKMWMPPGVANEKRWLRVYRNLPSMEKVYYGNNARIQSFPHSVTCFCSLLTNPSTIHCYNVACS